MADGGDMSPKPTTSEEWDEINDVLFRERNQLKEAGRKLVSKYEKRPTPKLEKQLQETRFRLEQVTERILLTNGGLVTKCVAKFGKIAAPERKSQYVAAGVAGLYDAVESYDMASGPFATWAHYPIMRAIVRAVNEVEHPSLGERDFGKRKPVMDAYENLQGPMGDLTPTTDEVAMLSGATPAQVERILPTIVYKGMGETWEDKLAAKQAASIFDEVPPDPVVVDNALEKILKEIFDSLTMEEALVLMRHRGLDGWEPESLEEVGKWLGISREKARRTYNRALESLKTLGLDVPEL